MIHHLHLLIMLVRMLMREILVQNSSGLQLTSKYFFRFFSTLIFFFFRFLFFLFFNLALALLFLLFFFFPSLFFFLFLFWSPLLSLLFFFFHSYFVSVFSFYYFFDFFFFFNFFQNWMGYADDDCMVNGHFTPQQMARIRCYTLNSLQTCIYLKKKKKQKKTKRKQQKRIFL